MTQPVIQFLIRYTEDVNPPNRMREFSDGLYDLITKEIGLKAIWGAQGGMATVNGLLYREEEANSISLDDREQIADWIRRQPIDCTATFGDPEPEDTFSMKRDLTELVFEVRNLTDADRNQARKYKESIQARLNAILKNQRETD